MQSLIIYYIKLFPSYETLSFGWKPCIKKYKKYFFCLSLIPLAIVVMTITHYAIYTRTLGEGGAYHVISLLTNEFATMHWRIVSMSSAFCLREGGNFLSLVY